MTDGDRPWEPPFAGTEAEHTGGTPDRLRATFRWTVEAVGGLVGEDPPDGIHERTHHVRATDRRSCGRGLVHPRERRPLGRT